MNLGKIIKDNFKRDFKRLSSPYFWAFTIIAIIFFIFASLEGYASEDNTTLDTGDCLLIKGYEIDNDTFFHYVCADDDCFEDFECNLDCADVTCPSTDFSTLRLENVCPDVSNTCPSPNVSVKIMGKDKLLGGGVSLSNTNSNSNSNSNSSWLEDNMILVGLVILLIVLAYWKNFLGIKDKLKRSSEEESERVEPPEVRERKRLSEGGKDGI